MSRFIVNSSKALSGEVCVSGSKNSALPILASCILTGGVSTIKNVPALSDIEIMCTILSHLGCKINRVDDVIKVDSSNVNCTAVPFELTGKIRASFLVAGPLLARFGRAEVSLPGGCTIGTRPVDLHLKGFSDLGAEHTIKDGSVSISCKELNGARICLDFPSVGATQNIIMAAVLTKGQTIIENCASEPEIVDLTDFLNKCGANIKGAGTDKIVIDGTNSLKGCTHTIIPDRIEAGTLMVASAVTAGNVTLKNVNYSHLSSVISKLTEIGVCITEFGSDINIKCTMPVKTTSIKTMPFPGFPTDMQSQIAALFCFINGTSVITETIFENRFMYVPELIRMNADIKVDGRTAVINGKGGLVGAEVNATDLRAGAALVVAGLAAKGKTIINNADYLKRGYCNFEDKLKKLGADVIIIALHS